MMSQKRAITIGVTGHRKLSPEKVPELKLVIKKAIDNIIHYHKSKGEEEYEPVFHSLIAAGADTLFADVALEHFEGTLKIYLPFEKEHYLEDFEADEKTRFEGFLQDKRVAEITTIGSLKESTREALYLQAGYRIVDENDYIIAIWNEKPAAGKGGTGEIVEYAFNRNKTVLVINPEEEELQIKILSAPDAAITGDGFKAVSGSYVIDRNYDFYDKAAIRHQKIYRSIWNWGFLLGWSAASIIAIKIALKQIPAHIISIFTSENVQFNLSILEILLLVSIFVLIRAERRQAHHSSYLQNRFIAETFRINGLVYSCGAYPFKMERKVIHNTLQDFQLLAPVLGVNKIIILTSYLNKPLDYKKKLLENFAIGQLKYHQDRYTRLSKKDEVNHISKYACFFFFLFILAYHAIFDFAKCPMCAICFSNSCNIADETKFPWLKWAEPLSIFFYLFLPVTIARLEGMKYLYDWRKLTTQSNALSTFFKSTLNDIESITNDEQLYALLKTLNENMVWENLDWEMFMKDKNEIDY